MQLTATLDHANNEVLVYQDSLGLLRGQLHITTKDKLKLKHVSIKLVRDELVDIADNDTAASGLYTNLQKASKTINTWAVLEERSGTQHILPEGAHKYSFELSLPVGLDSSVDTPSYKLNYFLESRVKYSSILKPDYALRTPITLVQVPTIGNLYSDDNVSLAIGPLPAGVSIESLNPLDIPVGQSVRLRNDVLDQAGQFVLRHVWDNKLAFRLTLPKGRSLFAGTKPVVEIETLPIAKGFRFTKVTLTLEEVVIMARPQKSGVQQGTISISEYQHTGGSGSSTSNNKTSSEGSIRRSGRKGSVASKHSSAGPSSSLMHPGHGQSLTNQSLNSITSISSNDDNKSIHSVASFTSQNHALALARDSSSEYSSAIAKTRELSTTTIVLPTSSLSAISSPDVNFSSTAEHGFLIARTRMTAPPLSEKGAHTDMSNSHIQIHHQISYTLEYKKVDADADSFVPHNSEGTSFDGGISASIHPRINAVAAMYKGLSEANILRRDELNDSLLLPEGSLAKPKALHGTLPICIVPAQVTDIWDGISSVQADEGNELAIPSSSSVAPRAGAGEPSSSYATHDLSLNQLSISDSRRLPSLSKDKAPDVPQISVTDANGSSGGQSAAAAPALSSVLSGATVYRSEALKAMVSGRTAAAPTTNSTSTEQPAPVAASQANASSNSTANPNDASVLQRQPTTISLAQAGTNGNSTAPSMTMPSIASSYTNHHQQYPVYPPATSLPTSRTSAGGLQPPFNPAFNPGVGGMAGYPPSSQVPSMPSAVAAATTTTIPTATGGDFSSDFSSMAQRHPTLANNPMFLQQLVMFYEHQIAQRDAFVKQLTSQYLQILQAEKQQQQQQQPQLQPQLPPPLQTQLQPQPQLQQDLGISMTSRPLNSVTSTNPMHSFANDPAFLAQQPFSSIINPAISSIHPNPAHAATASDSRLPALDAMSILSQQSMMSMSQGDPLRPAEPALHPGLNIRSAASANPMDMLSNPLLSSPTMHSFGLQPTQFAPSSSSHLHFGGAESSRTAARAAPSITGSPPTTANATIATASSPVNGANGVPATRQINSVVDEHADYGSPPPHYEAVPSALLQQPVVSQPPPYDRRV